MNSKSWLAVALTLTVLGAGAACSRPADPTAPQPEPPPSDAVPAADGTLRFLGLTSEPDRRIPVAAFDASLLPEGAVVQGTVTPQGLEIGRPYLVQWRATASDAWKSEPAHAGSVTVGPDRARVERGRELVLLFPITLEWLPEALAGKGEIRVCLQQQALDACSQPVPATRLGEVYRP